MDIELTENEKRQLLQQYLDVCDKIISFIENDRQLKHKLIHLTFI